MVLKGLMAAATVASMTLPATAYAAQVLGNDASACASGGPAIRVAVEGLKDRTGELKLELFPATEEDYLKDDRDLIKEGKVFRRVRVPTPPSGPIILCIKVPNPGTYGLLFTHNRDGKNKFSPGLDGAGTPSNAKLGWSKPKIDKGRIVVPEGVASIQIRAQYLRGLGGFGPISGAETR